MADYTDTTAIAFMLQKVYGEGLTSQFADETLTYHQFPTSEKTARGEGYEFATKYARSQSVGARAESSPLPDPLASKGVKGLILPKYIYGTLRLTGPMIEKAKQTGMGAFVEGLESELDDIYQSLVHDMNRQAWGDGFGLLGTLSAASDAVTTSGSTTWTVTMDNDLGVQRVLPGMIVDFFDGTAIDQSSVASRVSSVDPVNKTIEMEPNDSTFLTNHPIVAARSYTVTTDAVPDGAYMVRYGTRAATHATSNTPIEVTGLEGIFDDGTLLASFENITVATYPHWKANILDNSGTNRELTLNLMLQACDLNYKQSGFHIAKMRMGLGQRRKYANLLLPDVRFQPGKLKGGYETLTFAGGNGAVELVIDPAAPPNKIFCEAADKIQKYEMLELGWGNLDGDKMHRRQGYDEWDTFLRLYTQIGCEQRNALTLIDDLVDPGLYS
jgi:hypothetical protein